MSTQTNYSVDFYRQLSLLLKSGLPLPGSIRSLAPGFRSRSFRETIGKLADSVESGQALSASMRRFPNYFPEQYVEIVAAGESNGTLADAIHEIGVSSQADLQVVSLCRDIFFYPVIVVFVLAAIVIVLCRTTVYPMGDVYAELMDFQGVMPLVIRFAALIHNNIHAIVPGYFLLLGFCFWLLSGSGNSTRLLLGIVKVIPGFNSIFHELKDARLCIFWSMMLKREIADEKAFPLLAMCTDDPALKTDLEKIGANVAAGVPLVEAMKKTRSISPIIALTFQHVPEQRVPGELEQLSGMFLERASAALRRMAVVGESVITVLLALIILGTIISLFSPFIQIIEYLG